MVYVAVKMHFSDKKRDDTARVNQPYGRGVIQYDLRK